MLQSCQQPIPHGHPAFCYPRVGAFCSHFFLLLFCWNQSKIIHGVWFCSFVVVAESEQNNTQVLFLFYFCFFTDEFSETF